MFLKTNIYKKFRFSSFVRPFFLIVYVYMWAWWTPQACRWCMHVCACVHQPVAHCGPLRARSALMYVDAMHMA